MSPTDDHGYSELTTLEQGDLAAVLQYWHIRATQTAETLADSLRLDIDIKHALHEIGPLPEVVSR